MESQQNKHIVWYIVGAVVLVVIAALVWGSMQSSNNGTRIGSNGEVIVDGEGDDENGTEDDSSVRPERSEDEDERLAEIQSERQQLLAEQARIEAQLSNSSSTEDQQANAERNQEIERELLELQNEEEYPPLPDPGA